MKITSSLVKYSMLTLAFFLTTVSFGQDIVPFNKGEKWGFKDKKGKVVVKAQYDKVYNYDNRVGLAPVKNKGKWGFIDIQGNTVIPHLYEGLWHTGDNYGVKYVFNYTASDTIAAVEFKGEKIYINAKGKQAPGFISEYTNNGYAVCYSEMGYSKGKCGLIKLSTKEIVIPMEYYFLHFVNPSDPIGAAKEKDGKWGFINLENKTVIPFTYETVTGFHKPKDQDFIEPVARVVSDGVNYYINTKGDILGEANEATLQRLKEEQAKYEREKQAFDREIQRVRDEKDAEYEAQKGNSSGSSSSATNASSTYIYHCGYCAATQVGTKEPSMSLKCPSPATNNTARSHKWKRIAKSGNSTYSCSQCNTTVQSGDKPTEFENCSGKRTSLGHPTSHNWVKK